LTLFQSEGTRTVNVTLMQNSQRMKFVKYEQSGSVIHIYPRMGGVTLKAIALFLRWLKNSACLSIRFGQF
jgi:hypothetical protein